MSPEAVGAPMVSVELREVAFARSGDKGDTANVGVVALDPSLYQALARELTVARVKAHFRGVCTGDVERFELPRLNAINFLLHNSLGGGGTGSLMLDAQGKTLSTAMLRMRINIPRTVLESWRARSGTLAGTAAGAQQ